MKKSNFNLGYVKTCKAVRYCANQVEQHLKLF
jgi:hypothetical protein